MFTSIDNTITNALHSTQLKTVLNRKEMKQLVQYCT